MSPRQILADLSTASGAQTLTEISYVQVESGFAQALSKAYERALQGRE